MPTGSFTILLVNVYDYPRECSATATRWYCNLKMPATGSITLSVKQKWKIVAKVPRWIGKAPAPPAACSDLFLGAKFKERFRGSFPQAAEFRLFIAQLGQYNPVRGADSWAI